MPVLVFIDQAIDCRQYYKGQKGRCDQTAENHCGKRPLNFRTGSVGPDLGQQSHYRHQRCHDNRTQSYFCSFDGGMFYPETAFLKLHYITDHDHAVLNRYAEEGDKSNNCRHRNRLMREEKSDYAADHGKGDVEHYQTGVFQRVERPKHEVSETIAMRNKVASQQQTDWDQLAPKGQPSRTDPVEPLNSNLTQEQQEKMGKIRETRRKLAEDKDLDITPVPEFFEIWDLQ